MDRCRCEEQGDEAISSLIGDNSDYRSYDVVRGSSALLEEHSSLRSARERTL